ncbi:hypothetical protein ACP4OV_014843 [Aristida adscensionis]
MAVGSFAGSAPTPLSLPPWSISPSAAFFPPDTNSTNDLRNVDVLIGVLHIQLIPAGTDHPHSLPIYLHTCSPNLAESSRVVVGMESINNILYLIENSPQIPTSMQNDFRPHDTCISSSIIQDLNQTMTISPVERNTWEGLFADRSNYDFDGYTASD